MPAISQIPLGQPVAIMVISYLPVSSNQQLHSHLDQRLATHPEWTTPVKQDAHCLLSKAPPAKRENSCRRRLEVCQRDRFRNPNVSNDCPSIDRHTTGQVGYVQQCAI